MVKKFGLEDLEFWRFGLFNRISDLHTSSCGSAYFMLTVVLMFKGENLRHDHVLITVTLKCLSIGTPKIINFPFVSNLKLMVFRCPNIQTHYNEAVIYLNFGTPKNNEFSIWNKWKIYYF